MKVVDISFYFGIVVVILTFITMVCFVWEDIHRHKEKITQNIGKYGVFICIWLLLAFSGLIFVLSYGTNILSLMGETAIYDTKGKIGVAIFILWTVFIAVKYYLYVLFSEFTSDNKNDVIKIQRQTIFLSVICLPLLLLPLWEHLRLMLIKMVLNKIDYRRYSPNTYYIRYRCRNNPITFVYNPYSIINKIK